MLKRGRKAAITLALFSLPLTGACPQFVPTKAAAPALAAARPQLTLKDLQSVEELRTRFNQDEGTPRLILLLSPT